MNGFENFITEYSKVGIKKNAPNLAYSPVGNNGPVGGVGASSADPANAPIAPQGLQDGTYGGVLTIGGAIRSGQSIYDSGVGFWLGTENGTPKFSLGNSSGNKMTWNGTTLSITGSITASTGAIGGFTIDADSIDATNLSLVSGIANTAHIEVGTGANAGGLNSANAGSDIVFWAGSTHANRATAPFRVEADGSIVASDVTITGGAVSGTSLASIPNSTATDISLLGWTHDLVFSATDLDTVAWASGTITLSNGRTFSITGSNTGNISARTYIYLDTGVSSTALQTTTTAATAIGANKILVAVAVNSTDKAEFQTFGGTGTRNILVDNIAANSTSTNEFVANTAQIKDAIITNAKVFDLAVSKLTAGTITSKAINLAVSDGTGDVEIRSGIATGDFDNSGAASGFIIGVDDSDSDRAKFYFGDGTNYIKYNGVNLTLNGTDIGNVVERANSLFKDLLFLGNWKDQLTETISAGNLTRRLVNTTLNASNDASASLLLGAEANIGYDDNAGNNFDWDNDYDVNANITWTAMTAGTGGAGLGECCPATDQGAIPTAQGFRFYIFNGTLYASHGNGTTEYRTNVTSGVTITVPNYYRIVYTAGSSVKFYVNDVLKTTHAIGLPSGATGFTSLQFRMRNPSSGSSTNRMIVSNNYTVKCTP